MKTVHVAAALICDAPECPTRVLATARGYGEYKGLWEFPGGKLEPGETAVEALRREIREELEVSVSRERFLHTVEFDYPAFHLTMDCFFCAADREPRLKEAQAARWLTADTLDSVTWLPADQTLIHHLKAVLCGKEN